MRLLLNFKMIRVPIVQKYGTKQMRDVLSLNDPLITDLENGEIIIKNRDIYVK